VEFPILGGEIFDMNDVLRDAGAIRVPDAAGFNPGNELAVVPQQLAFAQPIQPQQAGYVYVWACQPKLQRRLVSNETQGSKVWFDDVRVTHTYSRVTQASDYYAFGSVMREQKSPDDLVYRYGYQGEYSEKDLETGWNHFELREFDAVVGRWTAVDPEGQYYSPYVGIGNDPINGVDPDGGKKMDWFVNQKTNQVLEAPGKGKGYEKQLGTDWAWLAKDGAFRVPDNFVFNSAMYTFDQNGWVTRTWDADNSRALMEFNNWALAPLEVLRDEEVRYLANTVTPGGPNVTVTSVLATEVWDRSTYLDPQMSDVVSKSRELWSEPLVNGYHRIIKTTYSYRQESGFWRFMRGTGNFIDGLNDPGRKQNSRYRNWQEYGGGPLRAWQFK